MALTKEEQDRLAEEYVARKTAITKENALEDMRVMIDLHCTKNGKFDSTLANKYRDKIAEYGIYCREEELDRWLSMCQGLIDSIKGMTDSEWLYDAWTVEATCELMQAMDGEINWDQVGEVVSNQGHTVGTISEVAQLLLAYSPNGIAFVDHMIRPRSIYKEMKGLRNAYGTEVNRRMRQERRERKQLGGRLVKCLGTRIESLNRHNI